MGLARRLAPSHHYSLIALRILLKNPWKIWIRMCLMLHGQRIFLLIKLLNDICVAQLTIKGYFLQLTTPFFLLDTIMNYKKNSCQQKTLIVKTNWNKWLKIKKKNY